MNLIKRSVYFTNTPHAYVIQWLTEHENMTLYIDSESFPLFLLRGDIKGVVLTYTFINDRTLQTRAEWYEEFPDNTTEYDREKIVV